MTNGSGLIQFPPKCPNCGIELWDVKAKGTTTWSFEEEHYHTMIKDDGVDYNCTGCDCDLNALFSGGIYSFAFYRDKEATSS